MDSVPSSWFWLFTGLFVVCSTVGALAYFTLFRDPLRSPLSESEEGSDLTTLRPRVYNARNVRVDGVYSIVIGRETPQTFCVRQIADGYFFITVYNASDGDEPCAPFSGWAVQFPSNHLIRQEDLLQNMPPY